MSISCRQAPQTHQTAFTAKTQPWVSAYLPSWSIHSYDSVTYYSTDNLPWDAFTHLFHFAVVVGNDYTISKQAPLTTAWDEPPLNITRAGHSRHKPVLLTVGGSADYNLRFAIQQPHRTQLISDMMNVLRMYEYDGFDIDYEINPVGGWGIRDVDTADFREFISEIYDSLQLWHAYYDTTKKPLLATATLWNIPFFVSLEKYFDQINLMTYQMCGEWQRKSWHQGALYSRAKDGFVFANDARGNELPSIQSFFLQYIQAGGHRSKLGLGLGFYGLIISGGGSRQNPSNGISKPLEQWQTTPQYNGSDFVNNQYKILYKNYIDTAVTSYRFDSLACAPYLSIQSGDNNPANEKFISFMDTLSIRYFFHFINENNVGGCILFDIGAARLPADFSNREKLFLVVRNERQR